MQPSIASVTITGRSTYSQSRQHDDPKLEGESHEDYDIRTWRSKMTVEERDGVRTVVIPAHGIQQSLMSAAKYSKKQIPGQGKATWTAKFAGGILIPENPALNIDPMSVEAVTISANADGKRGSGKRVRRRFPIILPPWSASFDVYILDPIITQDVFQEIFEVAGDFIGIGRFRPECGGTNGRFVISRLVWQDNRRKAA